MPKKRRSERDEARKRSERAGKLITKISDEFIDKASKGGLTGEEVNKAVSALRQIIADPHITGIRKGTPKIGIEAVTRSHLVVKVSISTAKTRKSFSIRRRL